MCVYYAHSMKKQHLAYLYQYFNFQKEWQLAYL